MPSVEDRCKVYSLEELRDKRVALAPDEPPSLTEFQEGVIGAWKDLEEVRQQARPDTKGEKLARRIAALEIYLEDGPHDSLEGRVKATIPLLADIRREVKML